MWTSLRAPVLELRTLVPERGHTVRGFGWIGSYFLAAILALTGGRSLARP